MSSFPSVTLSRDYVKVRFLEPNAPLGINQRALGLPRGVYLGFSPVVTPGSDELTLQVDPAYGFSLLKVGSQSRLAQVDIFTDQSVVLNFRGHTQWPVYVVGRADFQSNIPTQARIITRATSASGPLEVLLCKVNKIGSDLVVDTTLRQAPVAFAGQQFGFMYGGAIEQLADGGAGVAEVQAARTSPYTGGHNSLGERIEADLVGASLADRLGLQQSFIVSNSHPNVSGDSANVSGSFAKFRREFGPALTITAGGDETTEGAVTAPGRNYCFVVNSKTGHRLVDPVTEEPVFATLGFTAGTVGPGRQIQFTNASTAISGVGTAPFQAPLQVGDIILGPDGEYYELAKIIDFNTAQLGSAYQGADGIVTDTPFRRFTLSFETVASGPFVITTPISIRFVFPAFFRRDRAIYDGLLLVKRDGERPPLPDAGQSVAGAFLLAVAGGKVGSIRTIENGGSSIGSDFHTLNFVHGGAVAGATPGVVNVSVEGEEGDQGPPANQGPQGPTGPAGDGYSVNNVFEVSPQSPTPTPSVLSHTVDFSGESPEITSIKYLYGGFAGFDWGHVHQRVQIDSIQIISATVGQINGRLEPGVTNASFKLFLGAAQ